MTAAQYCEDRTRGSGSSFFYAFIFLPEDQRRAMLALYAFCREVDDVADEIPEKDVALQKMQFWREEVSRAFQGKPQHPVGEELNWARQHFALDEELLVEIMDGMLMDIDARPMLKASDLSLYCYRVAGAVGLLSIEIFGYKNRKTRDFATALGEALQITNILRDLAEDAERGRIYLPQEDRIRFKVADQDFKDGLTSNHHSENMRQLLKTYADKAEAAYQRAIELLPDEDRRSMRPSLLMAAIYYTQLQRIKQADHDVWNHSGRISPLRKIWIAWRTYRHEKKAQSASKPKPVRLSF